MAYISNLLKYLSKSLGSFESSIGTLVFFPSSRNDRSLLDEQLTATLEETEPEVFARAFVRLVCFPKELLEDGETKPAEPLLDEEHVQQLTTEDLEKFSQLYIENNPYLFKKSEQKHKEDGEGKTVATHSFGEIEHPQGDHESFVSYLHRLIVLEHEQQRKQHQEIKEHFLGSFSPGLSEKLRKSLSYGYDLKRALRPFRPEIPESNFTIKSNQPNIEWAKSLRDQHAARLEPFEMLADRLDQLNDISDETLNSIIDLNDIQTDVAAEIKSSSDDATRFSQKNFWLSIFITALTAGGLLITFLSMIEGSKQNKLTQEFSREALQKLNGVLVNLSDSITRGDSQLKVVLDEQLETLKTLSQEREAEAMRQKVLEDQLQALREENGDLKSELKQLRETVNGIQKSKN